MASAEVCYQILPAKPAISDKHRHSTYASPSWRWFIKAEKNSTLEGCILSKARRYRYLHTDFQFPWRFTGFQWWVTFQIYL